MADALPPLRDLLLRNGYGPAALRRLLNVHGLDDIGLLNHASARARIGEDRSSAALLTRVLFLEAPEPLSSVRRVLRRPDTEILLGSGLLRQRGSGKRAQVSPCLRVDPIGERFFLSDLRFGAADRGVLRLPRGDAVYPPSSDSALLSEVVHCKPGARVLDLCTGSGVQALMQAQGAEAVVAIDVNPRAVAMVRYNAGLNDVNNLEARVGDLYSPVRDERFDLILANPPFVSSPYEQAPSYHSGGPTGDRVLRRVIRGWRGHLSKGGHAFAVSHIGSRRGATIDAVARNWFRGFPGRALVLVLETGTAFDLAAAQSLFALRQGLSAYEREQKRWLDYLRRHRIENISLILIAAERSGRAKVEVVDARPRVLPLPLAPGPAERIAQWLAARNSSLVARPS
jgi:SAM-dependent methyltransferase